MNDLGDLPIPALELGAKVERMCESSKRRLVEEWLAEVAELFLERKSAWSGLFDKTPGASTALVEKYFASVNSLLSRQLRQIVLQTLDHMRNFLVRYADGNSFEGEYDDSGFTR